MDKSTRLKADHLRWEANKPISDELKQCQNDIALRTIFRHNSVSSTQMTILVDQIESRHPARNGFILVYRMDWINDKGDRPQPEDAFKVRLQIDQVQRTHKRRPVIYHKYAKSMRTSGMVGTFAQNERIPTVGQIVWLNPQVSGKVLRVCTGSPSVLSFVDVRVDGVSAIFTNTHDQLFDHRPMEVAYETDEGTIRVWE